MRRFHTLFIVMLALGLIAVLPVVAQEESDPEGNKALLTTWWETEATHNYADLGGFFAEDFVRHSAATTAVMPETQVTNLEEYARFLQGTAAMFPDYHFTPLTLVAEGSYVAYYGVFSGTFAQTGNAIDVPMMGLARFENGRIAELWTEWDNVTWNAQMQAPAAAETAEVPISSTQDVVGVWVIQTSVGRMNMELTANGLVRIFGSADCPSCNDQGEFAVEGSQIHWLSGECDAYYDVFVTKENDQPVSLRFDLVGRDCYADRRRSLDNQTLQLAQ